MVGAEAQRPRSAATPTQFRAGVAANVAGLDASRQHRCIASAVPDSAIGSARISRRRGRPTNLSVAGQPPPLVQLMLGCHPDGSNRCRQLPGIPPPCCASPPVRTRTSAVTWFAMTIRRRRAVPGRQTHHVPAWLTGRTGADGQGSAAWDADTGSPLPGGFGKHSLVPGVPRPADAQRPRPEGRVSGAVVVVLTVIRVAGMTRATGIDGSAEDSTGALDHAAMSADSPHTFIQRQRTGQRVRP